MQRAPLIILEADLESRSRRICEEYVWQPLAAGVAATTLRQRLLGALDRISRRLGGLRKVEVQETLERGFDNGEHQPWITRLLEWYYDPMYDYQLEGKKDRVIFRGDAEATRIYGRAYNEDPEFYAFLRTLESYREGNHEGSTLVLTTDSDFYRYLKEAAPR